MNRSVSTNTTRRGPSRPADPADTDSATPPTPPSTTVTSTRFASTSTPSSAPAVAGAAEPSAPSTPARSVPAGYQRIGSGCAPATPVATHADLRAGPSLDETAPAVAAISLTPEYDRGRSGPGISGCAVAGRL